MVSFFVVLALLLLAIVGSKFLFTPKAVEEKKVQLVKSVETYQVSSLPKLSFQGQVKKVGVVKILSQTSGIVQSVKVSEGDQVKKGQLLLNIGSNYQGANAAGVQAAIAARQYKQVTDTFDTQKDLIGKQRDLANTLRDNSSNLATISAQSKGETQSLINLNEDILNSLNSTLTNLKNSNTGGTNDAAILQTQQAISGFQAGQNQLQSAIRNLNYSTDTNNAPQHLLDLQRDIAVKGLDIQEKSLEMNRDITKLQLTLAGISASLTHPSTPVTGVVERVFVHPLDSVSPGDPLLTLIGSDKTVQLVAQVPGDVAARLSQIEPATIHFTNSQEELVPSFVSTEATDGRLHSVIFNLPENDYDLASDGDFVSVDLPMGSATSFQTYFVPLDAIVQTQDSSLVYVASGNKVATKKVILGTVSGKFAQVISGLSGNEKVILTRTVVDGDTIKPH